MLGGAKVRVSFLLTQEAASKHEQDNPVVKTALEMFGGRVIKDES